MLTKIHWIEIEVLGRLAVMPRPSGGDRLLEEIENWKVERVDTALSLLTSDEVSELELGREAEIARSTGLRFLSFPIPDRGVPDSVVEARQLARQLADEVLKGQSVAIHCRAGIGRSAVIAGCVLVELGLSVEEAFQRIARARALRVPDVEEQVTWLSNYARQ